MVKERQRSMTKLPWAFRNLTVSYPENCSLELLHNSRDTWEEMPNLPQNKAPNLPKVWPSDTWWFCPKEQKKDYTNLGRMNEWERGAPSDGCLVSSDGEWVAGWQSGQRIGKVSIKLPMHNFLFTHSLPSGFPGLCPFTPNWKPSVNFSSLDQSLWVFRNFYKEF